MVRMRRNSRAVLFLLALSFVGACSDSSNEDPNAECGPNKACPEGFTCNVQTGKCVQPATANVTLAISVTGMGSVSAMDGSMSFGPCTSAGCMYTVATNSMATLTAAPAAGWKLQGWSGDCTGTAAQAQLSMDRNRSCTATFVVAPSGVSVTVSPTAGGAVDTDPPLTCTSGTCSGSVAAGTDVTLTATPMAGYRFVSWAGSTECDGKTTTPLVVKVMSELMCTARFVQTLSVTVLTDVAGAPVTVTSGACTGVTCPVDKGASVTLSAGALDGYRFTDWTGDAACAGNPAMFTVQVDGPLTCQAHYAKRLVVSGLVQSTLTGDVKAGAPDASSVCAGNTCTVDAGDAVTLLAPTISGYRVTGWTGAGCEGGTTAGQGITILPTTANVTCTAQYVLGVSVSGTVVGAVGTVTATSTTGTCSAGTCNIDAGSDVTLVAPAIGGFRFLGWGGDATCTGAAGTTLDLKNVQSSTSCEAKYIRRIVVGWSVPAGITGTVTAMADDPNAACTASNCTVDQGTHVKLTPPDQGGFRFLGWNGNGCQTGTVTASDPVTCKATYAQEITVTGLVAGATGQVSAASTSPGNACDANACTLDVGGDVTLGAPDLSPGDRFLVWGGDAVCTAAPGVRTLVLSGVAQSTTCTASYRHRLKISVGTEAGVTDPVTLTLADPNATMVGADWYIDQGTGVTLTAPTEAGKRFDSWTGSADCNGKTSQTLSFTPTGDVSCTANYVQQYVITGAAGANGTVSVAADAASCSGRSCVCSGPTCTVDAGAIVNLTAAPAAHFHLAAWSGASCPTSGNPISVSNVSTTCTAAFAIDTFAVTSSTSPAVGSVTMTCPAGNCAAVPYNGSVTFKANPPAGYTFKSWTCTTATADTTGTVTLPITQTFNCVANFRIVVTGTLSGTGSVSGSASSGSCTAAAQTVTCTVDPSSNVTFTASPATNIAVHSWSGCSGSGNTATVSGVSAPVTCTAATFALWATGFTTTDTDVVVAASSGSRDEITVLAQSTPVGANGPQRLRVTTVDSKGNVVLPGVYATAFADADAIDEYAATGGHVIAGSKLDGNFNLPMLLITDTAGGVASAKMYPSTVAASAQRARSVVGASDGNVRMSVSMPDDRQQINTARVLTLNKGGGVVLDMEYLGKDTDCKGPRSIIAGPIVDAGGGGAFVTLIPQASDFQVMRLKSDGSVAWVTRISAATAINPLAAMAYNGGVVIVGDLAEAVVGLDAFVVYLDADGKAAFRSGVGGRIIGRVTADRTRLMLEAFTSVATGPGSTWLLTGAVTTTVNTGDGWFVQIDPVDGGLVKDMAYGSGSAADTLYAVAQPASGGFFMMGGTGAPVLGTQPDAWGLRVSDSLAITFNPQYGMVEQASGAGQLGTLAAASLDPSCVTGTLLKVATPVPVSLDPSFVAPGQFPLTP